MGITEDETELVKTADIIVDAPVVRQLGWDFPGDWHVMPDFPGDWHVMPDFPGDWHVMPGNCRDLPACTPWEAAAG